MLRDAIPEDALKLDRVVVPDDADDLAAGDADHGDLLADQLAILATRVFTDHILYGRPVRARDHIRHIPVRIRIRGNHGAEIGNDFIGWPDRRGMWMSPKRGVGGEGVTQAAWIAGVDRKEELSPQRLNNFGWIEPGSASLLVRRLAGGIGGRQGTHAISVRSTVASREGRILAGSSRASSCVHIRGEGYPERA